MTKGFWTAAALGLATIALAGCGEEPPAADQGPEAPEGVKVSDGRLVLPAVAGNPGVVYFTIENGGQKNLMIRAVSVEGAKSTTMHQMGTWNKQPSMDELFQIPVPPGETVEFKSGGLHIMANELADSVKAGGKSEVTLTFVGGDKVSFPAEVRGAGDDR